jgi:hypothetical protein
VVGWQQEEEHGGEGQKTCNSYSLAEFFSIYHIRCSQKRFVRLLRKVSFMVQSLRMVRAFLTSGT